MSLASQERFVSARLAHNEGRPPSDRALDMARLYKDGQTLEQIGVKYGVTRERVRQLIRPLGVTGKDGGHHVSVARKRLDRSLVLGVAHALKFGCSKEERISIPSSARTRFHQDRRNYSTGPMGHIGWNLSLTEWWTIWQESGHWQDRGRGKYVLRRHDVTKPHGVGNTFIGLMDYTNLIAANRRQAKAPRPPKPPRVAKPPKTGRTRRGEFSWRLSVAFSPETTRALHDRAAATGVSMGEIVRQIVDAGVAGLDRPQLRFLQLLP